MQTTLSWAHPFPSKYGSFFTADYQKENFSTVLAALEIVAPDISENEIRLGIENIHQNTGFYGRMQIVETNPTVIYDVSHNPEGIQSTFKSILSAFVGELHVIYGSSNDKDVKSIVEIFRANNNQMDKMIQEVLDVVATWKEVAKEIVISKKEQTLMSKAFNV